MTKDPCVLIVGSDRELAGCHGDAIANSGRKVVVCHDRAAALAVAEKVPVGVILAAAETDRDRWDVLALLDELSSVPLVMLAADVHDAMAEEARRRGALACIRNNDDASLRAILRDLAPARPGRGRATRVPQFEQLLASTDLIPCFQPIVRLDLPGTRTYGYESLARYRGDVPFCDCEFLFAYARRLNRVADLELACIRQTLRWGAPLAAEAKLFLNLHPHVFNAGHQLVDTILGECERNGVAPSKLVLEITEQEKLIDVEIAIACAEKLRAAGVQFALDDVGMSYSHLNLIDRIKPSYLKISQHFGTDFENDGSKRKIIRNIISLAADFDCDVVIEGIEESATSGAATELGARFGQGFLYARPQDAAQFA
jgi:EAL domain-containing protein (putative c-di-GMP-specific phosphodiesterase class I)